MPSRGWRARRGAARPEKTNSNSDTAENQNSPCGGVTNNTRGADNRRGDNKLAARSGAQHCCRLMTHYQCALLSLRVHPLTLSRSLMSSPLSSSTPGYNGVRLFSTNTPCKAEYLLQTGSFRSHHKLFDPHNKYFVRVPTVHLIYLFVSLISE